MTNPRNCPECKGAHPPSALLRDSADREWCVCDTHGVRWLNPHPLNPPPDETDEDRLQNDHTLAGYRIIEPLQP